MHTMKVSYTDGKFQRTASICHNADWSGEVLVTWKENTEVIQLKLPGAMILALVDAIGKQRLAARITSLITEKL